MVPSRHEVQYVFVPSVYRRVSLQASYSNAGVMFLGRLMEKVAGEVWEDYVPAHILKPLGMVNSGVVPPEDLDNMGGCAK